MNYTIHLTENCNLRCKYCYEANYYNKQENEIDFENIKSIIDREAETNAGNCVITFYGGEPLLKKNLIYKTIDYVNSKNTDTKFYYSMTTNGTLLDKEFLEYINNNNFINVSYSIDGTEKSHNLNRVFENGKGSFDIVKQNAIPLIDKFKEKVAMMVIAKNNINCLSENIEYLYSIGFRRFNTLFNYSEDWNDEDLIVIERELKKVAKFYYDKMMKNENIDIPLIDDKIKTHVDGTYNCNENCLAGMKSVNVGIDGNYYFCMQFVYNKDFIIGNCRNGIDFKARNDVLEKIGIEKEECKNCAIKKRCKHLCPCKNFILTNDPNELSPVVCEFERLNINIVDEVAQKLYEKKNNLFITKFYK